jgi:hypothetical protein
MKKTILPQGGLNMPLNELLLILIGGSLVVGTLYVMIRAIFLPNPSPDASPPGGQGKRPPAAEKPLKKKAVQA